MKTIRLQFKHGNSGLKPRRYAVEFEYENGNLDVSFTNKYSDGSSSVDRSTFTKQADGSYKNQNGVEYIVVKADLRKKPYTIVYRSGIGEGTTTTKFATIAEVRDYVKGRWNGVEYMNSPTCFHNDFGHFYLKNCSLFDLGKRGSNDVSSDDYYTWIWFDSDVKPNVEVVS